VEITELLWLEEVVSKIEIKHHVAPQEVEEVFTDQPKIKKMLRGRFRGEHVYRALGRTEAGRYLTVFFIYKHQSKALILSAREMDRKERRLYAKS
jgi:uncharacterized DUF497 family protein